MLWRWQNSFFRYTCLVVWENHINNVHFRFFFTPVLPAIFPHPSLFLQIEKSINRFVHAQECFGVSVCASVLCLGLFVVCVCTRKCVSVCVCLSISLSVCVCVDLYLILQ